MDSKVIQPSVINPRWTAPVGFPPIFTLAIVHTVALAVRDAGAPEGSHGIPRGVDRSPRAGDQLRAFQPRYDPFRAGEPWANRPRPFTRPISATRVYPDAQLETAETHDPLWNAAQKEMVLSGRMHVPAHVLGQEVSRVEPVCRRLRHRTGLNDRYEMDGRDPNGYTGIAWAIGGKHDAPGPTGRSTARYAICPTQALRGSSTAAPISQTLRRFEIMVCMGLLQFAKRSFLAFGKRV